MVNQTNTLANNPTVQVDYQLRLVEQVVLASTFTFAVVTNALVLAVMFKVRRRRTTRMAFYILNLTVADLCVAFFSTLPMLIWKTIDQFLVGNIICRLVPFLMLMSTYLSVYTLVAMTIDRYQAIVNPLISYTWTKQTGINYMMVVWLISIILAIPQLFVFRLDQYPGQQIKVCWARFPGSDRFWELTYIIWTNIVQFVLPVCILIFCYGSIYWIVHRSYHLYKTPTISPKSSVTSVSLTKSPDIVRSCSLDQNFKERIGPNGNFYPHDEISDGTMTKSQRNSSFMSYPFSTPLRRLSYTTRGSHRVTLNGTSDSRRAGSSNYLSRARLKTIKLTFIVVLAYIICSTPFYVGSIIMALNDKFLPQRFMNWVLTIFSLLLNLNSCSNPVICLALSSSVFRSQSNYRSTNLPRH